MRAVRIREFGEPIDVLTTERVSVPEAKAGQVQVRVLAAALNFPDVLLCRGAYQVAPDLPFTPGVELCGEIVALGDGVTGWHVGDRVLGGAVLPDGGFAEQAIMTGSDIYSAPRVLGDAECASLQFAYQTGWVALHRRAVIRPGETLLVHAAAGGVGSAAVQLGKAAGAFVIGVVGGEDKAAVARVLGADVVIDRTVESFIDVVNEITSGRGADVVYDPVGGDSYRGSTKCIAFEGRIILVGFAGGEIQSATLNHPLIKNYSIVGLHLGLYAKKNPAALRDCHEELVGLADLGLIQPLISERLSLETIADGLQRLARGSTVGRLVFVP